jgi:hypothetical protein
MVLVGFAPALMGPAGDFLRRAVGGELTTDEDGEAELLADCLMTGSMRDIGGLTDWFGEILLS